MTALTSRVRAAVQRVGFDVARLETRSPLGRHLGDLLRSLAVTHVIDVGANVGQFAAMIRDEAGFTGRIDSFEAVSASHAALSRARAHDAMWTGHHAAVTSQPGDVDVHLFPSSLFNSLSVTTDAGTEVFDQVHGTAFRSQGTERVPGVRLDDAALPDLGPTMLKVDTQGHDWSVLAGASRTLERVVLLSMELSFVRFYESSVPAAESIRRLEDLGFGLAGLYQACPAEDGLRIGEADGVFVRTAPLGG